MSAFRLPRFATFLSISAKVLQLKGWLAGSDRSACSLSVVDGSRGQISNRIEDGLGEFIQPSSLQSPVEGFTYTGARSPKLKVILVVGHRILDNVSQEFLLAEEGVPES